MGQGLRKMEELGVNQGNYQKDRFDRIGFTPFSSISQQDL